MGLLTDTTWTALLFCYCGWLATSVSGLSYHGNEGREYKKVARDALSAWKLVNTLNNPLNDGE